MSRRRFFQMLVVAVAAVCVLVLSGVLSAQGNSGNAFERVKEVQERHTEKMMAKEGVVGTAVGLDDNGNHAVLVLLERPGIPGIPADLEGVPVRPVVTGKIYALPKPPSPPGQDKKNRPPAAPTGLTATPVSETGIDLDWADNTEPDLSHYNVYCSETPGGSYDYVGSASFSDYSDTGLAAGTTYYYVVTAVDDTGKESDYSNEASATTEGGPVEPPAAPTNLAATVVSSSQIDLSWTDNAENENGFKIERDSVQIATVGASVTSYSDTGLEASTTYTYRVRAYNDAGNSAYSNEVSAETEPTVPSPYPRPARIGISTGHPNITAGTIGCRVTKGGEVYALSNNHVYADENNAALGDNVLQPGTYDGGQNPRDAIGTLAEYEPIVFSRRARNEIDAAIALCTTDTLDNKTPDGSYGVPSSTTVEASPGLAVKKHGRTTELTHGSVYAVNAIVNVGYDSGVARFVKQIVITPGTFSAGGDSGSAIVTEDGNNPVGLLFAGSSSYTIANPIDLVLSRFGVSIDDGT